MRWEYKTIKLATKGWLRAKLDEAELDTHMNQLGAEGWELAAAFNTNKELGETRNVVVVFKRQRA